MGKMQYLVVHTTDTPFNRTITPDDIDMWHKGVRHNKNGTYTFLGKTYKSKVELTNQFLRLPSGIVVKASNTNGRGWTQRGYSDMITQKGELLNLTPYDFDAVIDSNEITNGAAGYNSNSRHVVLNGGWSKDGKFRNGLDANGVLLKPELVYTDDTLHKLIEYIKMQKEIVPTVVVVGHNELANKNCPNFDVQLFLKNNNLL